LFEKIFDRSIFRNLKNFKKERCVKHEPSKKNYSAVSVKEKSDSFIDKSIGYHLGEPQKKEGM